MRNLIIIFLAVLLSGCSVTKHLVAMNKSTDDFKTLESDPRVKYESGAEFNAKVVADNLDSAIDIIQNNHYGVFKKPVVIYVTATIGSFTSFVVNSKAGATVLNERLFISPKKANTPERIPKLLVYELSHLYMEQYLGMWTWNSNVPSWFQEGLAVYASGGSGAENVTVSDAKKAIVAGKMFIPNESGNFLFKKTAHSFGLTPHMFYRQAGMFVSWLHHENNKNSNKLLL